MRTETDTAAAADAARYSTELARNIAAAETPEDKYRIAMLSTLALARLTEERMDGIEVIKVEPISPPAQARRETAPAHATVPSLELRRSGGALAVRGHGLQTVAV